MKPSTLDAPTLECGLVLDTTALDVKVWRDTMVVATHVPRRAHGELVRMYWHDREAACTVP